MHIMNSRSYETCLEIASRRGEKECIIWPLSVDCAVRRHGHRTRAHVAISRLAHGVEPDGMLVVNCPHSRLCVNPDHLHWSANGIPYDTIVCIRLLYGIYPNHILARAVGMTSATVCRIANRKVYCNVPSPAKRFNLEHWRNVVLMEDAACRS